MLIYEPLSLLSYTPYISGWTKPLPVARSLIRQTQTPDDQAGAKTVVQVHGEINPSIHYQNRNFRTICQLSSICGRVRTCSR